MEAGSEGREAVSHLEHNRLTSWVGTLDSVVSMCMFRKPPDISVVRQKKMWEDLWQAFWLMAVDEDDGM